MSGNWVSPNEIMQAAKDQMIDGREPESEEDWCRIVNFLAVNVARELAPEATVLCMKLYNCPLEERVIRGIVRLQLRAREEEGAKRARVERKCREAGGHPIEVTVSTSFGDVGP